MYTVCGHLSIYNIHLCCLLLIQKGLEMWRNVRLALEDDVSDCLIQWLLIIAAIAWGCSVIGFRFTLNYSSEIWDKSLQERQS